MKKRVMLYANSPIGSKKTILKQLNQLSNFVFIKDYIIVGILMDSNPQPCDFYNEASQIILETASEGNFDILLLSDMKQIIPKSGSWVQWSTLMKFNDELGKYGVQIFDLMIQDQPLAYEQFYERCIGYNIFSFKRDISSGKSQLCASNYYHIQCVDMDGVYPKSTKASASRKIMEGKLR